MKMNVPLADLDNAFGNECVSRNRFYVQPFHRPRKTEVAEKKNWVKKTARQCKRGRKSELRFKEIVCSMIDSHKFSWLIALDNVDAEQDRVCGYDFILTFSSYSHDDYKIPIDVKTGFGGIKNYRQKRGYNGVFIVVAGQHISTENIQTEIWKIWKRTRNQPPPFNKYLKNKK